MKAVYLEKKGGPESLTVGDIPQPRPGANEALIKVHATAVMPTEFTWFPTFALPSGAPRAFPIVLSHEFSGVIEAVGPAVTTVKTGDAVYGLNDWFTNGAQAEYCVAPVTALAPKPKSLDHVQAAVVPISALTAWQGLFSRLQVERGQRVLIHGATGAVGGFATQFAHSRGAHVIATTSSSHVDLAKELGADEVIDYRTTQFEKVVRDVDAIFDGVGGETLGRSWGVLRNGGKLVTISSQRLESADQRSKDAFLLVQADGSQLGEIGKLIDGGALRIFVEQVFPLANAREAYARAQKGNMRGKVALRVV